MTEQVPDRVIPSDGLAELANARRLCRTAPVEPANANLAPAAPSRLSEPVLPFQFRLRTMFVLVAAACGLFAVMQVVGAVWSAILVWFLILIVAHVTANFWGTRVAPAAGQFRPLEQELDHERLQREGVGVSATGAVRLSESSLPGWPMYVVTIIGAVVGGCIGGTALVLLSFERAGYTGVVVGTVSASVVGGFLGFLTSTFAEIGLRAWNEAVCGTPPRTEPACQTGHEAAS
jgi:hypothetical protein